LGGPRLSPVSDGPGPNTPGLAPKVAETLDALPLTPADAALAQLVREYAAQVDRAAVIAAQLAKLPASEDLDEEIARLRARVSAHTTLLDLGPKIQSALIELGATPKVRASLPAATKTAGGKLTALRGGA
jgi:hypothetical protein